MNTYDPKYQQKSNAISSAEPNYFVHFAMRHPVFLTTSQAGLEAAFQFPMPADSGLSPDAGSISNYRLTQEIYYSNTSGILNQP